MKATLYLKQQRDPFDPGWVWTLDFERERIMWSLKPYGSAAKARAAAMQLFTGCKRALKSSTN